jgi:hypothetical protein
MRSSWIVLDLGHPSQGCLSNSWGIEFSVALCCPYQQSEHHSFRTKEPQWTVLYISSPEPKLSQSPKFATEPIEAICSRPSFDPGLSQETIQGGAEFSSGLRRLPTVLPVEQIDPRGLQKHLTTHGAIRHLFFDKIWEICRLPSCYQF